MHRLMIVLSLMILFPPPCLAQEVPTSLEEVRKTAETAWQTQDWEKAAVQYAALVKLEPKNGLAWHHLGYALHATGKLDEALVAHEQASKISGAHQAIGLYNCACVHALKGRKDSAFTSLDQAIGAGFTDQETAIGDTDLESLRADPRWAKSLEKMKAAQASGQVVRAPFVQSPTRHTSRMAYFGRGGVSAIFVDYGPVAWKDEFAKAISAPEFAGKRWRLGSDFWTTLDLNVSVTLGGVKVEPGAYYLTLEKNAEGQAVLTLLDPSVIRKQKLDAFHAPQTKGGVAVVLAPAKEAKLSEELVISLVSDPADPLKGKFVLAFGPHTFEAAMSVHINSK